MTRRVARLLSAPPPPAMYPTDTLRNVRDAAIVQSSRALEMARAAGLEIPDAHSDAASRLRTVPAAGREGLSPADEEAFAAIDVHLAGHRPRP